MDVSFYYVSKNERQLAFDAKSKIVEVSQGELHIVYQDVCMCHVSRLPKKVVDGKRGVTVKTRPTGLTLCQECERLYKANKDSEWSKWTKAVDMGEVNGVRLTYVNGNVFATPKK